MSEYVAPVQDIQFVINELVGLERVNQLPGCEAATDDIVAPVIEEAAKLAGEVLGPANAEGDKIGSKLENGEVVVPPSFVNAYQKFVEGGWASLSANPEYDGMGLPELISTPVNEMWQSANISFALCPMLTISAIIALEKHGSETLKQQYLSKMVSGEWTGTMNLTEPQAGSDLAAITTKAEPEGEHYRITGNKIFITWGEHSLTENIIHMVLARLPDAPKGVKGISLFLVPKFLLNEDGSLGERNDLKAVSLEHKMGIHASPTCVMSYGDNDGAIGYLVGEAHNGLAYMFTMMNHARVAVGVQGLGVSERAYQHAKAYAEERVQGYDPVSKERVAIIQHPDVKRMLMLMKAQTQAMRALAYVTAAEMDISHFSEDAEARQKAQARYDLLTPIMKGWATEVAQEVTGLGVQIHGGMGFIEETGAAQYARDARILTIYEGTTGIQANDLVGRKLIHDNGAAFNDLLEDIKTLEKDLIAREAHLGDIQRGLGKGVTRMEQAVDCLLKNAGDHEQVGAISVNLLMLMGNVIGAWLMAKSAVIAQDKLDASQGDTDYYQTKIDTTRFYIQHILPRVSALLETIEVGAEY